MGGSDDFARFYSSDAVVRSYLADAKLKDAEPALLDRFVAEGLERMTMLDLGVGGGRTTVHFAPRSAEYVGIDYSGPLIDGCRRRFASLGNARFEVADVRDLASFHDDEFDVSLFAGNGIDAIQDLDGRMRALREIRRVTKPGGFFALSAHNLQWLPATLRLQWKGSLGPFLRRLKHVAVVRATNPDAAALARREWALVADIRTSRLRWSTHFFVRPREQLRQLREAGFSEAAALTRTGEAVPEDELGTIEKHWCYYLCRA